MALTKPVKSGRHHPGPAPAPAPPPEPAPAPQPVEAEPLDGEDEIQQLCQELNDAGYKAEVTFGQVVVSPWMGQESADVVDRLADMLFPAKLLNGWRFYQNWAVYIPPFLDHRLPDFMVTPGEAERFDRMRVYGHSTLLVVEVCSPGTRIVDWEDKTLEYGRARVPLFLIVDPVMTPRTVALFSDPLPDLAPDDDRKPYRQVVMVQEGATLELPPPFGLKIDTGALFG